MASNLRVAAVTGANKGIGLAIVRNLALQYPTSRLAASGGPLTIYLTARSTERGAAAVETLQHDPQLKRAAVLATHGGRVTITHHPLDVNDPASIHAFASFLETTHPSGVDVVVNNAGIMQSGLDADVVAATLRTNYYGTLTATEALLPRLRGPGARLVNVSSVLGSLGQYKPRVRDGFREAAAAGDVDAVTGFMEEFQKAVEGGRQGEAGFPSSAYAVSKAGVTGFTKALAVRARRAGEDVLINACCPGYVKTDLTKGGGVKTPDEGARTPVLLALGDIGGRSGEFWADEKVREW